MGQYITRKLNLDERPVIQDLLTESADVWNRIVTWHWRTVDRQGVWLSKSSLQRWLCSADRLDGLAASCGQAVLEQFLSALETWRANRGQDGVRPPYKHKETNKVVWKKQSLSKTGDRLRLSRGRDTDPWFIDWPHPEPCRIELGLNRDQPELRADYEVNPVDRTTGDRVAGIDLGIIHLAAVCDGRDVWLFNGKKLRSKRRYQNKIKATFKSKLAKKQEGSNRYKEIQETKRKQLQKVQNQINDILHKTSRRIVDMMLDRDVSVLVLGDVQGIENQDRGSRLNQIIGQWVNGRFRRMIQYKAKLSGMSVEVIDERYTSQTCPVCETRTKPADRNFDCPECQFTGHRDAIGAWNIRKKYRREVSEKTEQPSTDVVGAMASPSGIRFDSNAPCSPSSVRKPESVL